MSLGGFPESISWRVEAVFSWFFFQYFFFCLGFLIHNKLIFMVWDKDAILFLCVSSISAILRVGGASRQGPKCKEVWRQSTAVASAVLYWYWNLTFFRLSMWATMGSSGTFRPRLGPWKHLTMRTIQLTSTLGFLEPFFALLYNFSV